MMGSRLAEYESEFIRSLYPHEAQHSHHNRRSDSTSYSYNGTTSEPTSTSTTRSSVSEASYNSGIKSTAMPTSVAPRLPTSRHQQQSNITEKVNPFKQRTGSSGSLHEQYRAASQGDTMVPTNEIQEWAHQVHIRQRREYTWCTHCCPEKMAPLQIPSEKAMKKVRIQEPTHAYE